MYRKYIKRLLDIIISFCALVILSPILLIVAILVRIKLGSPVIFCQERPGRDEKIFKLYKFRTMTNKTDENGKLLPDSERLTKFGKILRSTSLDELPELWNILKGDMSLIGPRPLVVRYLPYYKEEERHRHDVRPGLTGLAQINGRNDLNWDKRFELDLKYIKNLTFLNDLKIIFKTIKKVIIRENVLSGNQMRLNSLDVDRKENIRFLTIEDIEKNEKALKNYITNLRAPYFKNDLNIEVDRIYTNMKTFIQNGTAKILGLFILEELKGFLWGYELNENIHINYFYIDSYYQNFGFGNKMLNELKNNFENSIELLVDKENTRGYKFYLKNGFEKIEENEKNIKLLLKRG